MPTSSVSSLGGVTHVPGLMCYLCTRFVPVDDLTLGEYIRLLQSNDRWARLSLRLDRAQFIKWLEQVRDVRNDVMHFDPDPVSAERLQLLREVVRMMQTLLRVGVV